MDDLEYLRPYKKECDLDILTQIKSDKLKALNNKSNQKYRDLIASLPETGPVKINLTNSAISIGEKSALTELQFQKIYKACEDLIPWRKGPFDIFGIPIDAEWRSDLKWQRIVNHLTDLQNKIILDIGCNNGYYLFKMLEYNPKMALGIDPVFHYFTQFKLIQHYIKAPNLFFELFGVENLVNFKNLFEVVFCMGILYHHRNPLNILISIRDSMKPGSQLILECMGIPGDQSYALFPEERYSKIKNIWFLPTLPCLINWLKRAKFTNIKLIDQTNSSSKEQRNTKWYPKPFESYEDFINPTDPAKTIEGYPAPLRFCISANKKVNKGF